LFTIQPQQSELQRSQWGSPVPTSDRDLDRLLGHLGER
jgi:hypothetical protein